MGELEETARRRKGWEMVVGGHCGWKDGEILDWSAN